MRLLRSSGGRVVLAVLLVGCDSIIGVDGGYHRVAARGGSGAAGKGSGGTGAKSGSGGAAGASSGAAGASEGGAAGVAPGAGGTGAKGGSGGTGGTRGGTAGTGAAGTGGTGGEAGGASVACTKDSQCDTGICNVTTERCVATRCEDGRPDGAETDTDCGGGTCPACEVDLACNGDDDCKTGVCYAFFCGRASGPPNWLDGPALTTARAGEGLAFEPLTDGQVLLAAVGGRDDQNSDTAQSYELLDTSHLPLAWSLQGGYLPNPFEYNPAVSDALGRVLAFSSLGTWNYTGGTGWQTALATMPTPRDAAAAARAGNLVYVLGGGEGGPTSTPVGVAEVYDVVEKTWTAIEPMPTPRSFLAAAATADGRVYAIGGLDVNVNQVATVEVYDPDAGQWQSAADLPSPNEDLAAVTGPDGRIYVVGGRNASALDTVSAYVPATNRWTPAASLSSARWGVGVAVLPDGHLWAVGGGSSFAFPETTVQVYGPVVSVSPEAAVPGTSVTVTGSNFAASANVAVYLDSPAGTPLATGSTNATGALVAPITFEVPNLAGGARDLVVMDDRSLYPITLSFRVQ